MNLNLNLDSAQVLNIANNYVDVLGSIDIRGLQRKPNYLLFNGNDEELYIRLVEYHQFSNRNLSLFNYLGILPEHLGLAVLEAKKFVGKIDSLVKTPKYDLPQSHIEFVNALPQDLKLELRGSFWGQHINYGTEFVSKFKKKDYTDKIKKIDDVWVVNFGIHSRFADIFSFLRNHRGNGEFLGLMFDNYETAKQIVEQIAQAECEFRFQEEKLAFELGLSSPLCRTYKMFDKPVFKVAYTDADSIRVNYLDDKGKLRYVICDIAKSFEVTGSFEDMKLFKTDSVYQISAYQRDTDLEIVKEMGIPLTEGTYIPVEYIESVKKARFEKYRQIEKDIYDKTVHLLDCAIARLNVEIRQYDLGSLSATITLTYPNGFTYEVFRNFKFPMSYHVLLNNVSNFVRDFDLEKVETSLEFQDDLEDYLIDRSDLETL